MHNMPLLTPFDEWWQARRVQELFPEVRVKVLYQRDYLHLLVKYGLEMPSQLADEDRAVPPLRLDLGGAVDDSTAESA